MLIGHILLGLVFGVEIILYALLGANVSFTRRVPFFFIRPQVNDNSLIAPATVACTLTASSSAVCKACPSGTSGGTITSPNYSKKYIKKGGFSRCVYKLTASKGHKVKMTIAPGANIPQQGNDDLVLSDAVTGNNFINLILYSFFITPLPTTSPLSYTTSSTGAQIFVIGSNDVCPGTCQWSITYSVV